MIVILDLHYIFLSPDFLKQVYHSVIKQVLLYFVDGTKQLIHQYILVTSYKHAILSIHIYCKDVLHVTIIDIAFNIHNICSS